MNAARARLAFQRLKVRGSGMRIGQAAHRSGVSAKMIRYYEEIGLLRPAGRTDGNYRQFAESDVHDLRFIRHARTVGLPVEDIAELLRLWRAPGAERAEIMAAAERHRAALDARLRSLDAIIACLRDLGATRAGARWPHHPVLDELADDAPAARRTEDDST